MNRLQRRIDRYTPLVFILPSLLGFVIFFIAPFLISFSYAFVDKPVNGAFAGLQNFIGLLHNQAYLLGLKNTLRFIGLSVPLNIALSLGVALLINKVPRHKELFALIFLIPLVIPSGSMVFFWKMLFAYDGCLNGLLYTIGLSKVNWLDSQWALFVVVIIFIWKNLGYNMVLFLAGLNNIPQEHYEAAYVDGANFWQIFRHVTLIGILPSLVLAVIMSIINSFKVFKEIYLITGNYPHESIYMLQHFMNNMFYALDYQKLATATSILVLGVVLVTQFLLKFERKVSS